MVLALALLLVIAFAVLAFGLFQAAGRRQPSPDPDRPAREGSKGRMFGKAIWGGLGLAVCGAIGYVLAAGWSGSYQGPMTGLPAAVAMMASLGAIVLGVLVALLGFVLKRVSGSRPGGLQDHTKPE